MNEKPCSRARHNGKTAARFLAVKDPAVWAIARMVVAGIDRKYSIHPRYKSYVKAYGKEKTQELIRRCSRDPRRV